MRMCGRKRLTLSLKGGPGEWASVRGPGERRNEMRQERKGPRLGLKR